MLELKGKTVLITGGAGFLGRALVRGLLDQGCQHIKIFSRDEHKHEHFRKELCNEGGRDRFVRFIIGDVTRPEMLKYSLRDVDYLVHAAALKIVPLLQYNPISAIEVNVMGWLGVVKAVLDSQRPMTVVGVSTDKAVEPLNTYGKAKALGEDLFINANVYSPTQKFVCVRYGNVIGSTSSLIEGLREHHEAPQLTHLDMTRFFLSAEQSVQTVLFAMEKAEGGELYVPKCKSVKIRDLMAMVCGHKKYELTGMRRGEKLHEVLINRYEAQRTVVMKDYYMVLPEEWASDGERLDHKYRRIPLLGEPYCSDDPRIMMSEEEMKDAFRQC